jgi:hypothetical protein
VKDIFPVFPKRYAAILLGTASLAACSVHKPEQKYQEKSLVTDSPQPITETAVSPDAATVPITQSDDPAPMPDVAAFIEKRDGCDHFRGEEPYDAERGAFINKAIAENCTGTDSALKTLRNRYKTNTKIMDKLKDYEDNIEVAP